MPTVLASAPCAVARLLSGQAPARRVRVTVAPHAQNKCVGLSSLRRLQGPSAPGLRAQLKPTLAKRSASVIVRAAGGNGEQDDFVGKWGSNIFLGLTWAGLVAYAALWSPNQTPLRDQYFLEKLIGLGADDGVAVNTVFTAVFNAMGLWPAMYSALIIPTGKSENGVPAWPFLTGSFALGAFTLIPYMALWQPSMDAADRPSQKELKARGNGALFERLLESQFTGYFLFAASLGLSAWAISSGAKSWEGFDQIFKESRLVHVTTVDFLTCSALAPFWVWNDAQAREWESPLLPVVLGVPFVGPALYLALRPRKTK